MKCGGNEVLRHIHTHTRYTPQDRGNDSQNTAEKDREMKTCPEHDRNEWKILYEIRSLKLLSALSQEMSEI